MDESKPSGSNQPSDKGNEENNEGEERVSGDAVDVNQQQTADILKLDIDCGEEAFDYLPIKDLVSVGETCKRLQQVAGYCYQQNYSESYCNSKGICGLEASRTHHNVENFSPFIEKIVIVNREGFQFFFDARSKFRRLKKLVIVGLKTTDVFCLKGFFMGKLDHLSMIDCDLINDFHEIIDRCTALKHLQIKHCTGEYHWLDRKYPTLKRFTFKQSNYSTEGILMFLKLNPNIRRFGTDSTFIWEHRYKIMTANIKLDDLAVEITQNDAQFDQLIDLLNKLHEHGFYRKLHLYFGQLVKNQEEINQLSTVNGLVTHSDVQIGSIPLTYSVLKSLKEIMLKDSQSIADLEILPQNLINLKYINFLRAKIDDIMPFIRRSVEMEKITVHTFETPSVHFNEDTKVIDLLALNREREKLPFAQKITLCVYGDVYLATKWAMKGSDFGLIRLKWCELEWNHDYV